MVASNHDWIKKLSMQSVVKYSDNIHWDPFLTEIIVLIRLETKFRYLTGGLMAKHVKVEVSIMMMLFVYSVQVL